MIYSQKSHQRRIFRSDGQLAILLAVSLLYVGFGMTMGLIQGGLPTVMRDRGMSLGGAGWLYLLYLPFGISFLWSPLVDRWRLPFWSAELGWIIPLQVFSALAAVAAALKQGAHQGVLFAIGLFMAIAMATMDIALDALVVERINAAWRPRAAAGQLGALAIGAILGGGAFVALFDSLGWTMLLLGYACCLLLFVIPLWCLTSVRSPRDSASETPGQRASLRYLLTTPAQRNRLILLTLACCVIFPLSALNRLMLLDLQVPMATIGWVVGSLGPLTMLITAVISPPLMQRYGLPAVIWFFTVVGVLALLAMAAGYMLRQPEVALCGAVIIGAAVSGIYVVLSARILGWSQGKQPATDYATFYGVGRFASTLTTIVFAQLVSLISWPLFYLGGALALLMMAILLRSAVNGEEKNNESE
ncbi:MAG: Protein AmpG [Candidatus Erwinia impunctatus]|nr:Protein AmpG [Culicoides impunctatus]